MSYLCGVERCPSDVSEFLERIGGLNVHGQPVWRMVIASTVFWKAEGGNVWNKNLTIAERGGINAETGFKHDNRPIRDDHGKLVEKRRYPHLEGWILQRWFPASSYDKGYWFAPENCMADGTPKLGPFPDCGDYEMMGEAVEHIPSKEALRKFISQYWIELQSRTGNVETRMRELRNASEYEEQENNRKMRQLADETVRDRCSYIASSSLEAGRIRTQRAERLGIREHLGN